MRNIGHLPPTLFLIGSKGLVTFMPESLADEGEKDDFATTARLMCIADAATACVMALEAWIKSSKPGEKFDETEPPSEAFDRQEVVVLLGGIAARPKTEVPAHHPQRQRELFRIWRVQYALHGGDDRPLRALAPDQGAGRGDPGGCKGHAQGQRCWSGQVWGNSSTAPVTSLRRLALAGTAGAVKAAPF
jgi:hypothetical protein